MAFQPPSLMFSSRIIGDVRVIVTCILGSTHEFKIIAASDIAHFISYFSGLITYVMKSTKNYLDFYIIRQSSFIMALPFSHYQKHFVRSR